MKDLQRCAPAKRLVGGLTVGRSVNGEYKGWETNKHTSLIRAIESATMLSEMCAQTVEWHNKPRDVEGVPDENTLTIEGDNSHPATQDRDEGVIAHAYLKIGDGLVINDFPRVGIGRHMDSSQK
jgi:hypothetical protein